MNKQDINNLIRWAVDTDLKKFSEDAYGVTGTAFYRSDDYLKEKFRLMQRDFIRWIASLDNHNRKRLAKAINNNPTNEEFDPNEIGIEATKIMMSAMNKKGE